jgi:hypothetical protein
MDDTFSDVSFHDLSFRLSGEFERLWAGGIEFGSNGCLAEGIECESNGCLVGGMEYVSNGCVAGGIECE